MRSNWLGLSILAGCAAVALAQTNQLIVGSEFGRSALGSNQVAHVIDTWEAGSGHYLSWDSGPTFTFDDSLLQYRRNAPGGPVGFTFFDDGTYEKNKYPPGVAPLPLDSGTWDNSH